MHFDQHSYMQTAAISWLQRIVAMRDYGSNPVHLSNFPRERGNVDFLKMSDFYILASNSNFQHYTGQQNQSGGHPHFCSSGFSETKTFYWNSQHNLG